MHFSPISAENMHYNALFRRILPYFGAENSPPLFYVLNYGGLSVRDALHYV
jgi:hypothetical protein